jgi:7,8-dihydropterin-6-yl-methyl-4-(beta-D-ribofuranosyl)aminobenzene 5'-phosphate synthase
MLNLTEQLKEVDALVIDVITDDVSDAYVSKTFFSVSEFANIIKGGAKLISGETLLCANLGYGLRVTVAENGRQHRLLFDTGTEGAIFIRNCENLAMNLGDIEDVAVTHGHWDHMGALLDALDKIKNDGGKPKVHVNPDMFNERGVELENGQIIQVKNVPLPQEIEKHGGEVVNNGDARIITQGYVYYSGLIPRVSSFEKGRKDHLCRKGPDDPWRPDPLLMDERMVVINVKGLGLVVLSACSHAGIVNVCTEVQRLFPNLSIYCVMGGLHLGGVMEQFIPAAVEGLKEFDVKQFILGHCTGWRALHAFANAYGEGVSQSAVGTTYFFEAGPNDMLAHEE